MHGVHLGDGTPAGLFGNDPSKPVLICKNQGAGKSVYMNLTLHRYGAKGPNSNYTDDRRTPSSTDCKNVLQTIHLR